MPGQDRADSSEPAARKGRPRRILLKVVAVLVALFSIAWATMASIYGAMGPGQAALFAVVSAIHPDYARTYMSLPPDEELGRDAPITVVELRHYEVDPDHRQDFLEYFATQLVPLQDRLGMRIFGYDADRTDPARVIWVRGFADLEHRYQTLVRFYLGPQWREHAGAVTPWIRDSSDVRLLDATEQQATTLRTLLAGSDAVEFRVLHPEASDATNVRSQLEALGGVVLTANPEPNAFELLPVRSDPDAMVWIVEQAVSAPGVTFEVWASR